MKRFLYLAPALLLSRFIPGVGFWGPVILLVGLIFFSGHLAEWVLARLTP